MDDGTAVVNFEKLLQIFISSLCTQVRIISGIFPFLLLTTFSASTAIDTNNFQGTATKPSLNI